MLGSPLVGGNRAIRRLVSTQGVVVGVGVGLLAGHYLGVPQIPYPMEWRKGGGLAGYVLLVEAVAFFYASTDALFLGMAVAFLGGVLVAVGIVVQLEVYDVPPQAIHSDIVASAILLASPIDWYMVYGCVFGCPG